MFFPAVSSDEYTLSTTFFPRWFNYKQPNPNLSFSGNSSELGYLYYNTLIPSNAIPNDWVKPSVVTTNYSSKLVGLMSGVNDRLLNDYHSTLSQLLRGSILVYGNLYVPAFWIFNLENNTEINSLQITTTSGLTTLSKFSNIYDLTTSGRTGFVQEGSLIVIGGIGLVSHSPTSNRITNQYFNRSCFVWDESSIHGLVLKSLQEYNEITGDLFFQTNSVRFYVNGVEDVLPEVLVTISGKTYVAKVITPASKNTEIKEIFFVDHKWESPVKTPFSYSYYFSSDSTKTWISSSLNLTNYVTQSEGDNTKNFCHYDYLGIFGILERVNQFSSSVLDRANITFSSKDNELIQRSGSKVDAVVGSEIISLAKTVDLVAGDLKIIGSDTVPTVSFPITHQIVYTTKRNTLW